MQNILVIKIGGGEGLDLEAAVQDVAQLAAQRPIVVVHGVSARMAQLSQEREIPVEMLHSPGGHSSRYTPPHVRDLFVEAALQVNTCIVNGLMNLSVMACGLCEPIVIEGTRKTAIRAVMNGRVRVVRDDYTGAINGVNGQAILDTLQSGAVAIIPPLANSPDGPLNIDGDRAAAAVASSLQAQAMVILSNVRGLYRDIQDETSLIHQVTRSQFELALTWADGRMKRKVLSAEEAAMAGVARVIVGDGRIQNPISQALEGHGTEFLS